MLRSLNVLIAFVVIVGINLLSSQFFTRIDLTEGSVYTLSESSKSIANSIPEELVVKAFVSENLPSQVTKLKQDLQDYLEEYEALADGRLKIEYIDPIKDKNAEMMATFLGVPPVQLQVFKKDQRQTVKSYLGVAVAKEKDESEIDEANPLSALDRFVKHESIPVLQNFSNFEYDFTAALKKVSSLEEKTIGFLTGHGEHELSPTTQQDMFSGPILRKDYGLTKPLSKNYTVVPVSLDEEGVLDTIDTLVVGGPKTALSDKEADAIQSFVAAGGNAILLIDQIDVDQRMSPEKIEENFANLLDGWGISVDLALVKDASHAHAAFSQGSFFSFTLPYPFWVKAINLSKNNAITSQLESFVLPWVSPLKTTTKEGVNTTILASTSPRFALAKTLVEVEVPVEGEVEVNEAGEEVPKTRKEYQERPIDLNPQQKFGITRREKTPLPLVVMAHREGEGKVVVIGDADFISTDFVDQFPSNLTFFLNIVDGLTLGDELISIRSKGVTDRPIIDLTEGQKNMIRWGNILLVPILVVVFGLVRKALRNARKRSV